MDSYMKKLFVSAIIGVVGAIVGTIALKNYRISHRLYTDDEYTIGLREAIGQNINAQGLYSYETVEPDPGVSVPAQVHGYQQTGSQERGDDEEEPGPDKELHKKRFMFKNKKKTQDIDAPSTITV
ncbi:unnamed protein product [Rotaria sordida]|uniref:Uncharacterized protein n=1 Tax=Rotaria sordida TaxID=392033 RepID=A0A814ZY94_9BILA|nr:unnamed protein product [Rotaria sordida]CAF3970566.1 unnamed protein product [Rotaria sordida]